MSKNTKRRKTRRFRRKRGGFRKKSDNLIFLTVTTEIDRKIKVKTTNYDT